MQAAPLSRIFSGPALFILAAAFFAAETAQAQPTRNGADEIEIRAEVKGPLHAQTIGIAATPKSATIGNRISMYTAALVEGVGLFFLDESGTWFPFVDCEKTPIVYYGPPGKKVEIEVVSEPANLTGLAGTQIFVGFGIDEAPPIACADMLEWQRFTLAHIVGAQ